jgi:phosphomethylpyrimidine synthase
MCGPEFCAYKISQHVSGKVEEMLQQENWMAP